MRDDHNKTATDRNSIHQFESSEKSISPGQGAWLPQLTNRNSDISSIENHSRTSVIRKRMKEQQYDNDNYEQDYNAFVDAHDDYDHDQIFSTRRPETYPVAGSFEDQLYRAFLANPFPDKRGFQTFAK